MISLPNFPTDNLYKFLAISGIILFLTALFYPEYKTNEINSEIAIFNGEIKKLKIENEKSSNKLDQIKSQIEILDSRAKINGSIVTDTLINRTRILSGDADLVSLSERIDNLIVEWKNINREVDLKSIDINVKSELIDNKRAELKSLNETANKLGPFSMIIITYAFFMWYNKTQKYQDRILSEQTNKYLDNERCQSCRMVLQNQENFNVFSEEDKKSLYCKNCYTNGHFTEPELTLDEMILKVKNRCKELKLNKIQTYFFVNRISTLQRWKEKFNW